MISRIPHNSENIQVEISTQFLMSMGSFYKNFTKAFSTSIQKKTSCLSERLILMFEFSNISGFVLFFK